MWVASPTCSLLTAAKHLKRKQLSRDGSVFFLTTYILLLGWPCTTGYTACGHPVELTLKPGVEKAIGVVLLVAGLALFGLGAWAAFTTHAIAIAGARG